MTLTKILLSLSLAFTSSCYYKHTPKEIPKLEHSYTDEELAPKEWDTPELPGYYFSPTWFKDHPKSCIKNVYGEEEFKKEVLESDKPVVVFFYYWRLSWM